MLVKMSLHIHAVHFMASMEKINTRENVTHCRCLRVVTGHILEKIFYPFYWRNKKAYSHIKRNHLIDFFIEWCLSCFGFFFLKHLLLLQIEFIAAVSSQALYLIHVRGDNSTATILFSDPIKGERKFLSEFIFHAKINLKYKTL